LEPSSSIILNVVKGCWDSKQAAAACAAGVQHLPHQVPLCFSTHASLETSSFLFAYLCSHDTKHTACLQALESIPAAEAGTFAAESESENKIFNYVAPPSHSLDHLQPCTQSL